MQLSYQVQHFTLCDGWVNCWLDDNESPIIFSSEKKARDYLESYIQDQHECVDQGLMDYKYSIDEYRVVTVKY